MFFVGDTFQVSELVMGWCILEVGSHEHVLEEAS